MTRGVKQLLHGLTRIAGSSTSNLLQPLRTSLLVQRNVHVTCSLNKELVVGGQKIRVEKPNIMNNLGDITESIAQSKGLYPDETTPYQLYDGVPYAELPIVNMKATKNNTLFDLTTHTGKTLMIYSAGVEGFKGCKKGTGSAAQQAAITFATRAKRMGIQTVRLRVSGFGLGRTNGLMGLTMGGAKIVSITDTTRISPNPPRPRGPRRL